MARRGPAAPLRPVVLVAAAYASAAATWAVVGAALPGGRWLAVHLFTLGVVTNLVLGLTDHFARTLLHQPGAAPAGQLVFSNVAIVAVLWGLPSGEHWLVGVGGAALSIVAFASYRRLRRLRRSALGSRFAWVVRTYEHAHGAFLLGALLGVSMGTGVIAGHWYAAARIAHLHANVLGWAGLTLLATIVFLGPTVGRTRIRPDADRQARRALSVGASALAFAVLAIVATGVSGWTGAASRLAAAAALVVYAAVVTAVCAPVVDALVRSSREPQRWSMVAAATWFPLVAWADAGVVAAGAWSWLDALGAAMVLGVLAQAITASIRHLAPLVHGSGPGPAPPHQRTLTPARALAWNAGVALVVVAAIAGRGIGGAWSVAARAGLGLVLAAALSEVAIMAARDRRRRRVGAHATSP